MNTCRFKLKFYLHSDCDLELPKTPPRQEKENQVCVYVCMYSAGNQES